MPPSYITSISLPYNRFRVLRGISYRGVTWFLLGFLIVGLNRFELTRAQQPPSVSFGLRKLAYSTNQFGLDLMRSFDRSDEKLAFSPICISSSLSMLLVGAHGSVATSLRHALYLWGMSSNEINLAYFDMSSHLGFNQPKHLAASNHYGGNHVNSVYNRRSGLYHSSSAAAAASGPMSLAQSLALAGGNTSENDVSFLTNIYVQRDFPVNYQYHMLLQRFYMTAVHPVDFYYNGDETRSHINAIVEKSTNGKIANILPTRQAQATQLLLLSALYFKGTLDLDLVASRSPFGPLGQVLSSQPPLPVRPPLTSSNSGASLYASTEPAPVWLEAASARIRYGSSRYLNCTTVEMPLKGGLVTLVLMMPNEANGLETLLTKLSAQVLTDTINSLEVKRVNVKMPRLTMDKSSGNLTWALSNMGLSELFKPGYAQLYDVSDYKWLSVSDVIHKTYLDIKESPGSGSGNMHTAAVAPAADQTQQTQNSQQPSGDQPASASTLSYFRKPQFSNNYNPNPFTNTQYNKHYQSTPPYGQHNIYNQQQHHYQNQQPHNPFKQQFNQHQNQKPLLHLNQPVSTLIPQASQPQIIATTTPIKPATVSNNNNDIISVAFDRPFLYFVMDNISGLVLVMGKAGGESPSREMASFGTYRLPI